MVLMAKRLEYVPPRVDEGLVEWSRESIGTAHVRPLVWTDAPPNEPGWWWVRFPGATEFEAIYVEPGFEYGTGLEWSSGALPVPYEPRSKRRGRRA